jgi:hypothetical protein
MIADCYKTVRKRIASEIQNPYYQAEVFAMYVVEIFVAVVLGLLVLAAFATAVALIPFERPSH